MQRREILAKRSVYSIWILLALSFGGCTMSPMGHSMGDWGHMTGYGGGVFMWLILVIVLAVIAYFIYTNKNSAFPGGSRRNESPLDILKRRYAEGEITKEEFDRLKKDIEG